MKRSIINSACPSFQTDLSCLKDCEPIASPQPDICRPFRQVQCCRYLVSRPICRSLTRRWMFSGHSQLFETDPSWIIAKWDSVWFSVIESLWLWSHFLLDVYRFASFFLCDLWPFALKMKHGCHERLLFHKIDGGLCSHQEILFKTGPFYWKHDFTRPTHTGIGGE